MLSSSIFFIKIEEKKKKDSETEMIHVLRGWSNKSEDKKEI